MSGNNICLFDLKEDWNNLLPLTYTRSISSLRTGILEIHEKWSKRLNGNVGILTMDYLMPLYEKGEAKRYDKYVNASILPSSQLIEKIDSLKSDQALFFNSVLIAFKSELPVSFANLETVAQGLQRVELEIPISSVSYPWDIFSLNSQEISADFALITKEREGSKISDTVGIIGDRSKVFFESGAKAEYCILNASNGPIYVGKDAEIMEGSVVRGPLAMCDNSVLKLSSKIYGATTLGPYCKVGGEVNNSVLQAYSNKGHDGFLGNSVIGEWCNLGADTNNSNLKNNYGPVKCWNYNANRFIDTGLQFCGLIMGDHSKSGINTMFNTGTVVGVSSNIYGANFPRNFIPSFSWGSANSMMEYKLNKALETSERMMERRGKKVDETVKSIMHHIYTESAKHRNY